MEGKKEVGRLCVSSFFLLILYLCHSIPTDEERERKKRDYYETMALWIPLDGLRSASSHQIREWEKDLCVSTESTKMTCRRNGAGSFRAVAPKISVYRLIGTSHVAMPFWYGVCQERKSIVTLRCRPPRRSEVSSLQGYRRPEVSLRPYQKDIEREALNLLQQQSGCCLMAVYPGGGKCFVEGTMIRMADGSTKGIECIVPGEWVRGIDRKPVQVKAVCTSPPGEDMYTLNVKSGTEDSTHQNVVVTTNATHLHYVLHPCRGWVTMTAEELFSCNDREEMRCRVHQKVMAFEMKRETEKCPYYGIELVQTGSNHTGKTEIALLELANGLITHNTMTAISLCGRIGCPTLVVTHRVVLMDQWMTSIRRMFSEEGVTVAILSPSQTSTALSPPPTFGIVNGMNLPKMDREWLSHYQTVVVDECHLLVTSVFSKGLLCLRPRYLIGLSATPFRTDGMDCLLTHFFGPKRIIRSLHREHHVYMVATPFVPPSHTVERTRTLDWNACIEYQSTHAERNQWIVNTCCHHPRMQSRVILVLCKRVSQIEQLQQMFQQCGNQDAISCFYGSMRTFDSEARILLATFQKVGVGFSHDRLDALVIATDCEEYFLQYLGRVFRRPDVVPMVVDLVDRHPVMQRHSQTRRRVYESCGGTVHPVRMETFDKDI